MAEHLDLSTGSKKEQYESLLPQIFGLLEGEKNAIANMANVAAALKAQFGWLWIGFYIAESEELVLGPFQGPIACTRIRKGRGVCGTACASKQTLIVDDVEKFPGHIACSSLSRSEIVVPLIINSNVVAILDADEEALAAFDKEDAHFLERIAQHIAENSTW